MRENESENERKRTPGAVLWGSKTAELLWPDLAALKEA